MYDETGESMEQQAQTLHNIPGVDVLSDENVEQQIVEQPILLDENAAQPTAEQHPIPANAPEPTIRRLTRIKTQPRA
jgi:hypothetical protein